MSKEPQHQAIPIRLPREDDVSARLLEPQDLEEKPRLTFTFSTIQILRILVAPLAITSCVFMAQQSEIPFWSVLFVIFAVLLSIWTIASVVGLQGNKKSGMFELRIGSFLCVFGTMNKIALGPLQGNNRPYGVILIDLTFCVLFTIITIIARHTDLWWHWREQEAIFGLTLTLTCLQLLIVLLNFFSLSRRAKIVIYDAEYDDKIDYLVQEIYMDNDSEPRHSISSMV